MNLENNNVEDILPIGETSAECAGERTVPGAVSAAAEESKKLPDIGLEGHGIKDFWRKTLRERKYLLICFFLPAAIMWLIYITMEVYPFGENSVLVLDLNGQYVYFFQALRDNHGRRKSALFLPAFSRRRVPRYNRVLYRKPVFGDRRTFSRNSYHRSAACHVPFEDGTLRTYLRFVY